jgi:peroxiredoxin
VDRNTAERHEESRTGALPRATGACISTPGGDMALEIGKKAPDFTLLDQDGNKVKLSDFKGKSVVVFFYPKALTSG